MLYAVDERKTDGRGPVDAPAAVHALAVNGETGTLRWVNSQRSPGPRPTFLSCSEEQRVLVSANHGDFQHVEQVVRQEDGRWSVEFQYDDSTLVLYALGSAGSIDSVRDVHVFKGKGLDPNQSPQNGGHAQASPHAHCAVLDPSGRFLLVCDKGTDRIYVFTFGERLSVVSVLQLDQQSGPRHLAFDPSGQLAFATLEFSSRLLSMRWNATEGRLSVIESAATVADGHDRLNEPAEVRVHPSASFVYVNNRGEDSMAWFRFDASGRLSRAGATSLARSIHPGLAARSFTFTPGGATLLVADRPAHRIRLYSVSPNTGDLAWENDIEVPDPAYICIVESER
jgi:6-phosphogluconolactonase